MMSEHVLIVYSLALWLERLFQTDLYYQDVPIQHWRPLTMDAADADLAPFRDWLLVLPRQIPADEWHPRFCPRNRFSRKLLFVEFNVVM